MAESQQSGARAAQKVEETAVAPAEVAPSEQPGAFDRFLAEFSEQLKQVADTLGVYSAAGREWLAAQQNKGRNPAQAAKDWLKERLGEGR